MEDNHIFLKGNIAYTPCIRREGCDFDTDITEVLIYSSRNETGFYHVIGPKTVNWQHEPDLVDMTIHESDLFSSVIDAAKELATRISSKAYETYINNRLNNELYNINKISVPGYQDETVYVIDGDCCIREGTMIKASGYNYKSSEMQFDVRINKQSFTFKASHIFHSLAGLYTYAKENCILQQLKFV